MELRATPSGAWGLGILKKKRKGGIRGIESGPDPGRGVWAYSKRKEKEGYVELRAARIRGVGFGHLLHAFLDEVLHVAPLRHHILFMVFV